MAQNVTIMGASYTDVPAVTLPKTGGGTAKFTDVSPTDAVESDVASGKIFFKADGSQATGTASSGGGGDDAPINDVVYFDYDGKILYSYSLADFLQLSAHPANPTHAGLTSQGWNWTLSDAQAFAASAGGICIGQMYVTTSGATEIDIYIEEYRKSIELIIALNGTVTVDWGDNTAQSTETGTNLSRTATHYVRHDYAVGGLYTIKIYPTSGDYMFACNSNEPPVGGKNWSRSHRSISDRIKAVRFGTNYYFDKYVFDSMENDLEYITMPSNISGIIGEYSITALPSLKALTIPPSFTSVENYAMGNLSQARFISFPNTIASYGSSLLGGSGVEMITLGGAVTSVGEYCMSSATAKRIFLPSTLTSLNSYSFGSMRNLLSVVIPSGITALGSMLSQAPSVKEVHFKPTTPPTQTSSWNFTTIPQDCIFYVPTGYLSDYQSATNYPNQWSGVTYMEE